MIMDTTNWVFLSLSFNKYLLKDCINNDQRYFIDRKINCQWLLQTRHHSRIWIWIKFFICIQVKFIYLKGLAKILKRNLEASKLTKYSTPKSSLEKCWNEEDFKSPVDLLWEKRSLSNSNVFLKQKLFHILPSKIQCVYFMHPLPFLHKKGKKWKCHSLDE